MHMVEKKELEAGEFVSGFDERYTQQSRLLLRQISENSRTSILNLSKKLKVSRKTAKDRLLMLRRELGIRYTIEFNESVIKLTSPHVILAKFTNIPDYDEVTRILSSSYIPQLAVAMKGKYDLFIYANATSSSDYVHWDKSTQIKLAKYGVSWHASDVAHEQLGYFPLRNEAIDHVPLKPELRSLLKVLNSDSRITFSDISKSIGMHFNTVAYNFNKLLRLGIIKRFTISMSPPRKSIVMSLFSKYVLSDGFEEDAAKIRKVYTSSGMDYPTINRYVICAQLVGSNDFFTMGVFDNYDTAYSEMVLRYKDNFSRHKVRVEYGSVSKVLLGRLPLRSIDAKKEYNIIKWNSEY
ncbi:Lrp/AsnC family transcriptional regulator [Candidatus Marsarchaeota archaeon]|nr:Lrp/AsnC family transcriptional regulator [Candidatus Marsarchaeota archaeon]